MSDVVDLSTFRNARCGERTASATGTWRCRKRPHPATPNQHGFVSEETFDELVRQDQE